jgi:hypothetical protein
MGRTVQQAVRARLVRPLSRACRFAAFRALYDAADPLLDRVGLCIDPAGRLYDSNDNGTPETPWPSCAALANTDTDDDGVRDHETWGCAPTAGL